MGKLENGPHGHVSGKVGNTVSYTRKGQNIIRTIGVIKKKPTVNQLAVRQRMKLVTEFLKPVLPFINMGFQFVVADTTRYPHNEAVSYNFRNAVEGQYPNYAIDYTKVKVSAGDLEPAINPTVKKMPVGVEFSWDTPELDDFARKRDRAMLLIYCPNTNNAYYVLNGALRSEGKDIVELPEKMINQNIEAYISFISGDSKSVSDSVYCQ